MITDMEAPDLTEAMRVLEDAISRRLHVHFPGRIVAYAADTGFATVQPLFMERNAGEAVALPMAPIARVPVIHPRTAAAAVYLPVVPGDLVTVLVGDRDMGRWRSGAGQPAEPPSARIHDRADCWAILGGYPSPLAQVPPYGAGRFQVVVTPGVGIALGNGQVEALELLDGVIDRLANITDGLILALTLHIHPDPASGNTGPPTNAATFTALGTELLALQVQLAALRGV